VEELLEDAFLKDVRLYQGRRHEPAVGRAFEKIIVHFASYSPLQEATLCSDFTALLLEISKLVQGACEPRCDDRIRPIILEMNRNFKREVDLEEYAEMAGVSCSRFTHLFKESVGMSPYAYVLHLRLTRASDLLLASEAPISEIAFSVGFSDPLYFSRAFKKAFGQSPDLYRKTKS
jgi:AraC family transcriptional regulator of arabinose operon